VSNPVHARTQVVSVLFIDLVAFSKDSTASQHTIKVALIQHLIAALALIPNSQYLMRDTGDGAFVAFKDTPELALYTALALWRSCTHSGGAMPLPLERLRVRSEAHSGPSRARPDGCITEFL
jgi:class 3 adenylate cyclase